MVFNMSAYTIQWGKGQSFQQVGPGKPDIHIQKNEGSSLPNTVDKG